MSTIFVGTRNRSHQLLRTAQVRDRAGTSNIVAVGMGTAGCRRVVLFLQRMAELAAVNRVQSAVFYDCNEVTINHISRYLVKFMGKKRGSLGVQALFPGYVPVPNGFTRNPQHFREFWGPCERDMDNVIERVSAQASRAGRNPALIIEFMGFGGHAVLGGLLHRKLRETFPSSVILPVLMLPNDHVCQEWTRRYIWEQYEELLAGSNCLVTTQTASSIGEDDIRLATGLAGAELAEFEDDEAVESPLASVCRRLTPSSGGWLGMATAKRRVPMLSKFNWSSFPPWWRKYAALGPDDEMSMSLGHAVWSTLDPAAQMAAGVSHAVNAPQEVVVSLPIHPDLLEEMASEAAEALERSTLFARYPNMDVAFNTARFNGGIKQEPYMHLTRLYPIQGELGPVMDVMHPNRPAGERRPGGTFETGFGSYYHMDGGSARSLAPAGAAAGTSGNAC